MKKSNLYKVIVYYDDGTKDVREWANEIDLACKDFLRIVEFSNARRCELVCISRYVYEIEQLYIRDDSDVQ